MSREFLLRSLSAIALSVVAAPSAFAGGQAIIQGGGATAAEGDYAGPNSSKGAPLSEFSTYNASTTATQFGFYWASSSGVGQTAFVTDDLTCDINFYNNGGACSGTPGGADTVHYTVSESTLSTGNYAIWTTGSYGQVAAGNLIQLPSIGTGLAFPVVETNVTANGQLELSDNDLCEIFSGGYTDFSQITDSGTFKPAAGTINVVYRSDSGGTTGILTEHLTKVCTEGTNSNIAFKVTTTFASLFPSGVPANFTGEKGNGGIINYLENLDGGPTVTQALSYVSQDWTSIAKAPDNQTANGAAPNALVVAVFNGTTAYLPTTTNIETALKHVLATANGVTTPPSTAAEGANPFNWVPVIETVSAGYPVVGYGTLEVAECYANSTIEAGVIAYLTDHYKSATYKKIQKNNGFVSVANTGAAKFVTTIYNHILANTGNKKNPAWNINIGNATACAGLPGR